MDGLQQTAAESQGVWPAGCDLQQTAAESQGVWPAGCALQQTAAESQGVWPAGCALSALLWVVVLSEKSPLSFFLPFPLWLLYIISLSPFSSNPFRVLVLKAQSRQIFESQMPQGSSSAQIDLCGVIF
jgi:hypothetical protein